MPIFPENGSGNRVGRLQQRPKIEREEQAAMVEESGDWIDAKQKPTDGRPVLALLAVPNMGYPDEARAWVIARWDVEKNYWRIVDAPNSRGHQSPVDALIKSWRNLPSAPTDIKIVGGGGAIAA